jgi:enoyl-CoA hydratase/carnithine racemase
MGSDTVARMSERISLDVVDGIAYATLNRADKLNSLDFRCSRP